MDFGPRKSKSETMITVTTELFRNMDSFNCIDLGRLGCFVYEAPHRPAEERFWKCHWGNSEGTCV